MSERKYYNQDGKQISEQEAQQFISTLPPHMQNRFNRHNPQSNATKDGVATKRPSSQAEWAGYEEDWRVKLAYKSGSYSNILSPLDTTGGMVFPYTPTVIVNHTANYDALHPVHSNYPFYAYSNSQVDQITITGDFVSQTESDARYWVAAMHFLRSSTKMAYGESTNQGNPPPLLELSGYGQFVFNKIPIVLQTFMVDLPADVDYIETTFGSGGRTHVPVKAQISCTVVPQYSRSKVEQFSLDDYINGKYLETGGGFL